MTMYKHLYIRIGLIAILSILLGACGILKNKNPSDKYVYTIELNCTNNIVMSAAPDYLLELYNKDKSNFEKDGQELPSQGTVKDKTKTESTKNDIKEDKKNNKQSHQLTVKSGSSNHSLIYHIDSFDTQSSFGKLVYCCFRDIKTGEYKSLFVHTEFSLKENDVEALKRLNSKMAKIKLKSLPANLSKNIKSKDTCQLSDIYDLIAYEHIMVKLITIPGHFEISGIKPEKQKIDYVKGNTWEYRITALKHESKTRPIDIAVFAEKTNGDIDSTDNMGTHFSVEVLVDEPDLVDNTKKLINDPEYLLTALIIPLFGWLYNNYRKKKAASKDVA
jgi:hypothetical protein